MVVLVDNVVVAVVVLVRDELFEFYLVLVSDLVRDDKKYSY